MLTDLVCPPWHLVGSALPLPLHESSLPAPQGCPQLPSLIHPLLGSLPCHHQMPASAPLWCGWFVWFSVASRCLEHARSVALRWGFTGERLGPGEQRAGRGLRGGRRGCSWPAGGRVLLRGPTGRVRQAAPRSQAFRGDRRCGWRPHTACRGVCHPRGA